MSDLPSPSNPQASTSEKEYLFVVGSFRSGTSVLHSLLNRHPQISLLYELEILALKSIVGNRPVQRNWAARLELWNQAISRHKLERAPFISGTIETINTAIYTEYGEKNGAKFIGEKSPLYCGNLPELLTAYPNARFLIVWRNFADTVDSAMRAGEHSRFFRTKGIEYRILNCFLELARGRKEIRRRGAQILEINYGQLVDNPEHEIARIGQFLGLEFAANDSDLTKVDLSFLPAGEHHVRVHEGKIRKQSYERRAISAALQTRLDGYENYLKRKWDIPMAGNPSVPEPSWLQREQDLWKIRWRIGMDHIIRSFYGYCPFDFLSKTVAPYKPASTAAVAEILNRLDQAPSAGPLSFSIITPSHNQPEWLALCSASVRDQVDSKSAITVEHIIQDANTANLKDRLTNIGFSVEPSETDDRYRLQIFQERDNGMYDAINRGFKRGTGDILAWLNCDEQYLPGTLEEVARFFRENPEVDVLFGDALLVDENNSLISYRRMILPTSLHIQLSHLNTLSCATFVRRSIFERGFWLDPSWKAIADAIWIRDLLKAKFKMAVLQKPLSAFAITRSNLGQTSLAKAEMEKFGNDSAFPIFWLKWPVIFWHRVKKFGAGAYGNRQLSTSIYSHATPKRRITISAQRLPFSWPEYAETAGAVVEPEPVEKQSPVIQTVVLSVAVILLARLIDAQFPGVTLMPLFSLTYLLVLAFFVDPLCEALAAFVCAAGVLASFANFGNILPNETASNTFIILRMAGFMIASSAAVLFSYMRVRAKLVTTELSAMLTEIPAPLIVSDATGYITFANREAHQLFAPDHGGLVGKKWPKIMLTDRDEGSATRFYIDFFSKTNNPAKDTNLYLQPTEPTTARLICLGVGKHKHLITVLHR